MSDLATTLATARRRAAPSGRRAVRRWHRRPSLVVGGALVALFSLAAAAAPWLAGADPDVQLDAVAGKHLPPGSVRVPLHFTDGRTRLATSVERRGERVVAERLGRREVYAAAELANLPPGGGAPRPHRFLLGSDRFSRDLWARLLYGARVSLAIGVLSVLVALTLGTLVGTVAGMAREWVDTALMRFTDAVLAIPRILLLVLVAALFDPGPLALVVVIGATVWMPAARLVRGEVLGLRQRGFVVAARGLGAGPLRLAFVHLLPNALTPLAVYAGLMIGGVILLESALSFLGLGVRTMPSWGAMIEEGFEFRRSAWWVATFPGAALTTTVLAFNLLSDGLRDLLDPHRER